MATSSNPGLYAVGFVAQRRRAIVGAVEIDTGHDVEMIRAATATEAEKVGKAFALVALPAKDGWTGHSVKIRQANQVIGPQSQWKVP